VPHLSASVIELFHKEALYQVILTFIFLQLSTKLEILLQANYAAAAQTITHRQTDDIGIIFGGDFNVNMDDKNPVSDCIKQFASVIGLHRCDQLFLGAHYSTYHNEHLNSYSTIDFLLTSNDSIVANYIIDWSGAESFWSSTNLRQLWLYGRAWLVFR